MNKYCRICWNTKNWKQPTGEAAALEKEPSYVAENGFGHEEWLFNFEWLITGFKDKSKHYRYGFLQPIGKYLSKYQGTTLSVLLYTVSPDMQKLIVAKIDKLYVPQDDELKWAFEQVVANGWLSFMQKELRKIAVDPGPLYTTIPEYIINVRFEPENVTFYDPRLIVTGNHKILNSSRYHPLNWDDDFPSTSNFVRRTQTANNNEEKDPKRSEQERIRSSIDATIYDPRHTKLQNRLYLSLCEKYGKQNVSYEKEFVDLVLSQKTGITYIEIKMELTVKRCIRLALGQLLEYSCYPVQNSADKLLIVGDAVPTENDQKYLSHIRSTYNLPVFYSRWSWSKNHLEYEI